VLRRPPVQSSSPAASVRSSFLDTNCQKRDDMVIATCRTLGGKVGRQPAIELSEL
jgi:hypothetical protein